eukprot:scaffold12231_cov79-Phaeocystis_antarctica.AAC.1
MRSVPGRLLVAYRKQKTENIKRSGRVRFQRGEGFRFQISQRSGPACSMQNSEFRILGSPERRCVWCISVTFQKAQIMSHTPRNIDRVPKEKTRKHTVRSH